MRTHNTADFHLRSVRWDLGQSVHRLKREYERRLGNSNTLAVALNKVISLDLMTELDSLLINVEQEFIGPRINQASLGGCDDGVLGRDPAGTRPDDFLEDLCEMFAVGWAHCSETREPAHTCALGINWHLPYPDNVRIKSRFGPYRIGLKTR